MPHSELQHSEVHGPPLPAQVRSAWDFFEQTVREHPDNLALASVGQPHDLFDIQSIPLCGSEQETQYLRWTFKDLRAGIARLVAGFNSSGVKPGDLIFTFLQNGAEFVLTKYALIRENPLN